MQKQIQARYGKQVRDATTWTSRLFGQLNSMSNQHRPAPHHPAQQLQHGTPTFNTLPHVLAQNVKKRTWKLQLRLLHTLSQIIFSPLLQTREPPACTCSAATAGRSSPAGHRPHSRSLRTAGQIAAWATAAERTDPRTRLLALHALHITTWQEPGGTTVLLCRQYREVTCTLFKKVKLLCRRKQAA